MAANSLIKKAEAFTEQTGRVGWWRKMPPNVKAMALAGVKQIATGTAAFTQQGLAQAIIKELNLNVSTRAVEKWLKQEIDNARKK